MGRKTISNTFTVNTIEDGTSPYLLNLTNETESIACDDQGTPYLMNGQRQTASTKFNFFVGNSRVRPTRVTVEHNGQRLTSGVMMDGFLATWTTSGITIEFYQSYQTEGETVTVKYDGTPLKFDIIGVLPQQSGGVSVIAVATFAVVPVKGTALYRIIPSTDQIVKHAGNSYTPAGDTNITCSVTKTVGGVVSTPDPSEYTLNMIKDGGSEVGYQATRVDTITSKMEYILYVPAGGTRIMDKETIPVVSDGTSPYFADIDNEMDSIPCTSTGVTTTSYDKYINISLWHGTTPETLTTLTTSTPPTNVTLTPDAAGKRIRVQVSSSKLIAERSDITITVASANSGNKTLHFILNGVRGGASGTPAIIFSLNPSTSSIKRNKDNTLTPTSPMTCDVQKIIGNGTPSRATSSDGTLRYRIDGDITSSSDGNSLAINTGQVTYGNTNKYIVFAFFVGTTMVDKERIPIIYDGEDGEDAHEVNPNILLDTAEYKTGVYDSSTNPNGKWYKLNGVNSGNYEGRVARYVDTSNTTREGSPSYYRRVAEQQVAYTSSSNNKLSANTWYTLSAYFKGSGTGALLMLQATGYFDSVFYRDGNSDTYTSGDLVYQFSLSSAWTRHTLTFKTKSSMSSSKILYASTRLINDTGNVYVAMMKLEQGDTATAYLPNEADLEGANAPYIQVRPTSILYQANKNGAASGEQSFSVSYYLKVNGVTCSISSANNITISCPSNVSASSKTTSSCTITVADSTSPSGNITLTMTGTYNSKTYTATTYISVAGVKAGADGSRGKIGRAYYYAGEWDELASSFQFIVNDTQAPYFGYQPSGSTHGYYVFNPETNGTYVKSSVVSTYGNPSANNAPWSKMNDDQEYIITKAIFGDYAQFGGSIINQDWLMSVHGDVNVAWRRNTEIESYTSISAGNIYSPTWIGLFWAKTGGTHTFYINYEYNNSPFTVLLYNRTSNTTVFSQDVSSQGGAIKLSYSLTSGYQYLLCAYKSSSSNPNPVITNVTMDTPVPSGSTFPTGNYLYLDPMTGGAETILSDNEITVSTNSSASYQTIVAYDMPLASLSSYYFYFELKGSDTTSRYVYWYLDRKENGSWVQRFSSDNNSRFTVNKADWTEYKFNLGFGSNAGGQYRLRIYASSSTVIMRKVSVAAGASFAPQFGVDLYRGTVSMNNVHVRGTVDAIDGEFHGTVYAKDGVFNGTVYAKGGEFSGKVSAGKYLDIGTYGTGNCLRLDPSTPSIAGFNNTNKTLEVKAYTSHTADGKTKYGGSIDMGQTFYSSNMWKVSDGTYSVTCVPAGGLIQIADASGSVSIRMSGNVFHIKGVNALLPLLSQADVGELYRDADGFVHIRVS